MAYTILLPFRGSSVTIFETINSLKTGLSKDSEILIIDDGISSDLLVSLKKIKQLKIISNSGIGLVDALNTGIEASKFEFIARIDSDDLIYKNRFSVQEKFLTENEDIAVLGSQITFIDIQGEITGQSNYPTGLLNNSSSFKTRCSLAHPSVMFRKSVISDAGGYRKVLKYKDVDLAEDFDLWIRVSEFGKLYNLDYPLTYYRQHDQQMSNKYLDAHAIATIIVSEKKQGFKHIFELSESGFTNKEKTYKLFFKYFSIKSFLKLLLLEKCSSVNTSRTTKKLLRFCVRFINKVF